MADRLKGITVEIGGDTTDLSKALKGVSQESRSIQGELSDVQRLLRFNPDNVELLEQRQQLLNRQIENTSQRLNQLREAERQVQQQFQRGEIGEQQFRAFQREIIATEGRLQHFQREAENTSEDVKRSFKDMGGGLANAIAGAAAGAGIDKIVEEALNTANLDTTIDIGFNVPEEGRQAVKDAISLVQTYGVDGEAAIEGVRRQWAMNLDQTTETNAAVIKGAAMISKSFSDIDFTELIQEINEISGSMGISQEEALAMTNTLLKMGFPPDQLDIITEYGSQLKRAGFNAMEIQGIMAAGVETNTWNIDVLLDGLKEGRIVLSEFGQGLDKATMAVISGTDISAKQLESWGRQVAAGGATGQKAMIEVAQAVANIDDKTKQNEVGVKFFGTLWEENGTKITDTLMNASKWTGDAKKNQDSYNKSIKAVDESPQVKLNTAISNMNTALTPLLTMVADFIAKVAEWAANNPKLTAGIVAITAALGIITGIILAIIPAIALLTAENIALAASFIPLVLPIMAVVAAIAAAIAIGVLIYKNWDKIMAKGKELAASIRKSFEAFKRAAGEKMEETRKKISDVWDKVVSFFKGISLRKIGADIINGLITGISNTASNLYKKAKEMARGVYQKMKDTLQIGSPSKVTMELGRWTGEGFVQGLNSSINKIKKVATNLSMAVASSVTEESDHGALKKYFDAIRKTGNYKNDWLKKLPKQMRAQVEQMGKTLAPKIKGTKITKDSVFKKGNTITVNLNSPKALDVREANKAFSRSMAKMSLMW
jgi:phage-related minor tail protein